MNDRHADPLVAVQQAARIRYGSASLALGGISLILPYLLLGVALLVALIMRMGNLPLALLIGVAVCCIFIACVAVGLGLIALRQTRALPNKREARRDAWTGIWSGAVSMLQGALLLAVVIGLAHIPLSAAS